MTEARYDGWADFYDQRFAGYMSEQASSGQLRRLVGDGSGFCLDVGCGTGLHFQAIQASGRTVVGIDLSFDQLRLASDRSDCLVRSDALRLPFPNDTFHTAVSTFIHTDVDDMRPIVAEIRRVLAPRGLFVYLGVHPFFWGPSVERTESGSVIVHPGYRKTGWHADSPYWSPHSLRRKVGFRHSTVSDLVNDIIASGLTIRQVDEGVGDPPGTFALVATKV